MKNEYAAGLALAAGLTGAGLSPAPEPVVETVTETVVEEKFVNKMPPVVVEAWNNAYSAGSQDTRRAMGGRIGPNSKHTDIANAVQGLAASHNSLAKKAKRKSAVERYRSGT